MLTFIEYMQEANYGPGDWGWHMPSEAADKKFKELAGEQRGKPERAMLKVQFAFGGGALNPVVEKVGDLINRISPAHPYEWAIDETLNKINSSLMFLKGMDEKFEQESKNNAEGFEMPLSKFKERVNKALEEYTKEHSKLPVYNEVQYHARQAAIEVGHKNWWKAVDHLKVLKYILETTPERAKEFKPDLSQYKPPGRLGMVFVDPVNKTIDYKWKKDEPDLSKAPDFAIAAHGEQKRKYTGVPYWKHCEEVAKICQQVGLPKEAIAAAWLHDTVEDTPVTIEDIKTHFGDKVAALVAQLTDVSKPQDGNRATRKEIDRKHYIGADPLAQSVKLADTISNTADITKNDPNFAKVYVPEIEKLLPYLQQGNKDLFLRAKIGVENAKQTLGLEPGPCEHPWQRAADHSRCGKRAKGQ